MEDALSVKGDIIRYIQFKTKTKNVSEHIALILYDRRIRQCFILIEVSWFKVQVLNADPGPGYEFLMRKQIKPKHSLKAAMTYFVFFFA